MVQKRSTSIVFGVLLRVVLLAVVSVAAFYTSPNVLDMLNNYFGYRTPGGFFTLADIFVSLDLALVFWSGIFFGVLGRKIDYILIGLFVILAVWEFSSIETATTNMYLGLVGIVVISNATGFALKLLRQRFLPKLKI